MYTNNYIGLNPMEYIMYLFENTDDNMMSFINYSDIENPQCVRYPVNWTYEDAQKLSREFDSLIDMFERFGKFHFEPDDEDTLKEWLTPEEISVWETYIKPFEPFEVEEHIVDELVETEDYTLLTIDERELIRRRYKWRNTNSLKRLPYKRRSPYNIILGAQRYVKAVSANASQLTLGDEMRNLALEMVLYHHLDKNQKDRFSILDRILLGLDD